MTIFNRVGAFLGLGYLYHLTSSANKPKDPISEEVFQKAIDQINGHQYLKFPKAPSGATPVFLPPELPIVLKKSNALCMDRLQKMEEAKQICERNQYTHLAIPSARIHGDFLIEERLPISRNRALEQMGFYLKNKDKMTPAIREFTGFLCQTTLTDLEDRRHTFIPHCRTSIARFDNMTLFEDKNGEMKIALIDLESFSPEKKSSSWIQLIPIFPHHFKEIVQEARKFDPTIIADIKSLETLRDAALETYEMGYVKHEKFLHEKMISKSNSNDLPPLSLARKKELEASFIKSVEYWNSNYNYGSPNRKTPLEKMKKSAYHSFPHILDLVQKEFSKKINHCPEGEQDIVDCRSFLMEFPYAYTDVIEYVNKTLFDQKKAIYGDLLIIDLLKEMAKRGDLYEYQHNGWSSKDLVRL